jgi:enamine deaminase RidA (YjgF/YER057c/UK114 family)
MEVINPSTIHAPLGNMYQHGVKVPCKSLIFLSGQIPMSPEGKIVGTGPARQIDLEAQLRQVYSNLTACLKEAGAGWKDVVRVNTYVVSSAFNEYRNLKMREIVVECTGGVRPPGTVVGVFALMPAEALLEIELVAAVGE